MPGAGLTAHLHGLADWLVLHEKLSGTASTDSYACVRLACCVKAGWGPAAVLGKACKQAWQQPVHMQQLQSATLLSGMINNMQGSAALPIL